MRIGRLGTRSTGFGSLIVCRRWQPRSSGSVRLSRRFLLLLSAVVVGLGGCTGADMDELEAYIDTVQQRPPRPIPPAPEIVPYESYSYNSAGLRDPFAPVRGLIPTPAAQQPEEDTQTVSTSAIQPDFDRRREPLERFPLDSLRMVGTLSRYGTRLGLIQSRDGTIHTVRPGDHLGQNYGEIQAIRPDSIPIVEIIPDGLGGWMERENAIALSD